MLENEINKAKCTNCACGEEKYSKCKTTDASMVSRTCVLFGKYVLESTDPYIKESRYNKDVKVLKSNDELVKRDHESS